MTKMEALVQDLFTFRDRFFETHPIELAREKREMVDKKMKEVLDDLDQLALKEDIEEETLEKKAYRTYLKGRVLNVAPDHCPEAEQLLSKAVKLEPNLVNAWIELGECYWKRGEALCGFKKAIKTLDDWNLIIQTIPGKFKISQMFFYKTKNVP